MVLKMSEFRELFIRHQSAKRTMQLIEKWNTCVVTNDCTEDIADDVFRRVMNFRNELEIEIKEIQKQMVTQKIKVVK